MQAQPQEQVLTTNLRWGIFGDLGREDPEVHLPYSSGEAEFVAMVSGACEARYVKDCLEYMVKGNYNVEARLRGDSAAGRGIAQRVGCGRVRHLDAGLLWLQQAVKERMFKVGAIAGTANPSDLGTKPVPAARLRELLFKLGAVDESYWSGKPSMRRLRPGAAPKSCSRTAAPASGTSSRLCPSS